MTADEILEALNGYQPAEGDPDNIWQDVIYRLFDVDGTATDDLADDDIRPGEGFVVDGVVYFYVAQEDWWRVLP